MLELNKVYLGDCLEVMRDIDNKSVDLVLIDSPYGIEYKSNKQLGNTRKGYTETTRDEHYFENIIHDDSIRPEWFSEIYRVLKDDSALYCFCSWKTYSQFESYVELAGFKLKNMIVLNKSNHGMGDLKGSYANKHELMIFAAKGRHILNQTTGRLNDIWNVKVKFSGSHRYHPTEKPLSWLYNPIQESSQENDLVLDCFAGSGTTGLACQKLGRNFILIEKAQEYVEICKKRLEDNKVFGRET